LKNFNLFLSISISLFILQSFTGCKEDSTTPTGGNPPSGGGNDVSGKIVDEVGNGLVNVTVVIGGQNTTTAADGSFTIRNVTTPYDLKAVSAQGVGIVYKSVSTRNPQVLGIGIPVTPNQAQLTVGIPRSTISNNQIAAVMFTDAQRVQASGKIFGWSNDTTTTFTVIWKGASTVSGKIIVLIYTMDGTGHISSYNLYGEKVFTLNNGANSTVGFNVNELPIPPGQSTVSGSVTPPSLNYINTKATLSISFVSTNNWLGTNVSATLLDFKPAPAYVFNVPTGLSTTNRLIVTGSAFSPGADTNFIYQRTDKSVVAAPGSTNNIALESVPDLITPANNAVDIDTNTIFTYTSGSGSGLYMIYFYTPTLTKQFYVFTTALSTTIPNLLIYGQGIGSNLTYNWFVTKILGITTTDDFLSGPIVNNNHFIGTAITERRQFITTP
jgi:hypothetical protein